MRIIGVLLLTIAVSVINAQQDTLPFKLTSYNNMIVEAVLNQKDTLDLMFHTALSSVSVTHEAVEKLKKSKKRFGAEAKSWGGSAETSYTENNMLQIGRYTWDSMTVWLGELSGQFSDGKFGPSLWESKVVEIDFEKSQLIIHETLPSKAKHFSAYDVEMDRGSMFIAGRCFNGEHWHKNKFMIHSGYAGTILLDDEYASRSEMNKLQVTDESELRDSYGNVLKKKKAIMSDFYVGNHRFENIPMGFFEGKIGNQKKSLIGGELLKRFHIIIDREKETIYLKPNALMKLPIKDV